jgi:hypothetical protein
MARKLVVGGLMALGAVACSGGGQTGEPTTTTPAPAAAVDTTVPVDAGTVPVSEAPAPVDETPAPVAAGATPPGPGAAAGGGANAARTETAAQAAARADYERQKAEILAKQPELREHMRSLDEALRQTYPLSEEEVNRRALAAMADPSKQVHVVPMETTTIPTTVPPAPVGDPPAGD